MAVAGRNKTDSALKANLADTVGTVAKSASPVEGSTTSLTRANSAAFTFGETSSTGGSNTGFETTYGAVGTVAAKGLNLQKKLK